MRGNRNGILTLNQNGDDKMTIPHFLMFAVPSALFLGAAATIVLDNVRQRQEEKRNARTVLASCGCFYCR